MIEKYCYYIYFPSISCTLTKLNVRLVVGINNLSFLFIDFEPHQSKMFINGELSKPILPIYWRFNYAHYIVA